MITFSKVSKTYTPKKGVPVEALKEVSFSLPDKGLFFILGRSGSGKSTALHLLGGLDSAKGGDIIVDGKSTKDFTQKDWDAYRNACAGFVFQDYNLFDDFTVRKNIALALELEGEKRKGQKAGHGYRRAGAAFGHGAEEAPRAHGVYDLFVDGVLRARRLYGRVRVL